MTAFKAGILSTGTEILQGLYPDTNAQWLSERFHAMGLQVLRHMAAPDNAEDVADGISFLLDRCDVIVMTGGLGPTEDDLTRDAVARVFGTSLAEDTKAWRMIEKRWTFRGSPPPPSNRVQCLIPKGALTLYNHWGTAPGFLLKTNRAWFVALPGPPREMRPMFLRFVEGRIRDRFAKESHSRLLTLHTVGCSESSLNDSLRSLFEELREDSRSTLAFLAGMARVDIRIHVQGDTPEQARSKLDHLRRKIVRRIPKESVYGRDEDTLESVVSKLLRKKGLTLATAESCTGGLVAKRITDLPGSSDVFRQGWVVYSNDSKKSCLGVSSKMIEKYGAASSQVARQMALGALKRSHAQVAVALTGIAGPGGGTEKKPVGLVYYGLAWRFQEADPVQLYTTDTCVPSTREVVRLFSSHYALDLIRRLLLGFLSASDSTI